MSPIAKRRAILAFMIESPEQHPLRATACRASSRLRWLGDWLQWTIYLLASCDALAQTADRARRARGGARAAARQHRQRAGVAPSPAWGLLGFCWAPRIRMPKAASAAGRRRSSSARASTSARPTSSSPATATWYRPRRRGRDRRGFGLANVNAGVGHKLAEGWRGFVGLTIPTHGEVGSKRGRERISLSYEHGSLGQMERLDQGADRALRRRSQARTKAATAARAWCSSPTTSTGTPLR